MKFQSEMADDKIHFVPLLLIGDVLASAAFEQPRQRNYPWPLVNLTDWATVAIGQFQPLLAKLVVLPKDALPISVLNLRSAIRSPKAHALERELTPLVQNRLTREREFFLLERRRLGWLAEEMELKPELESPFWSGS